MIKLRKWNQNSTAPPGKSSLTDLLPPLIDLTIHRKILLGV
jgi:hypothetical protein